MMKVLALGLSAALAACTVGSAAIGGGGGDDTGGTGSDAAVTPGGISGHITASTTWMGTVNISGDTTIDAGATVTVMPGTILNVAAGANIVVLGTLSAVGTSAGKITIQPTSAAPHFGDPDSGITVGASPAQGGTLTMNYVNMIGGSLRSFGSGAATIKDSTFSQADGDLLQMSDTASMDFEYSSIGMATSGTDTTHCDMHFASAEALGAMKVSHSNVSTSSFGVMFYAGTNADFTYDNWFMNTTNVDPTVGQVSGDFSNGYFDANPPMAVTGLTANTLSMTMLATCLSDASNDVSCAGPHP